MKIPSEVVAIFEKESEGLIYGEVRLALIMRDGRPRYLVTKEQSICLDKEENTACQLKPKKSKP